MTKGPKRTDWDRLERASIADARREYREKAPGRRVEEQIELSRELTGLARRSRA